MPHLKCHEAIKGFTFYVSVASQNCLMVQKGWVCVYVYLRREETHIPCNVKKPKYQERTQNKFAEHRGEISFLYHIMEENTSN